MKNTVILIVLLSATFFSACKKASDDPAPVQTGSATIEFDNQFEKDPLDPTVYIPLVLNTKTYTNAANESYTISKFRYYISNIKLKKADGSVYAVPESYYLIDAGATPDSEIELNNIPLGNYTGMSYVIGVDSARNVSGAQTGALDTSHGMYWDWNQGYIFMMFEGTSPQSTAAANILQYHVGGFRNSTNTNALQTINHSFTNTNYTLNITGVGTPEVHLMVEAAKVAKNQSFATMPTVHMPGAAAISISNDYASMFSFSHIHN